MNLQGVQTLVPWRGIPFTLQKTNIHNYRLDDTEQKNHLQILIVFRGNHWFPYLGFGACANRPVDLALMVTPGSVVNTHLIIFMRSPLLAEAPHYMSWHRRRFHTTCQTVQEIAQAAGDTVVGHKDPEAWTRGKSLRPYEPPLRNHAGCKG
jgi:hypothetical protein